MHWHASDDLTLQHYLEGCLPEAERQAFAGHLQSCASCRTDLEAARRLEQLCENWSQVPPPPQLSLRLQQQFRPHPVPYGWLLAVAAAILLGFGISRGFWRRPDPTPELGLYTPPPSVRPAPPQVEEQPPGLPLTAEPVWTTGEDPSLVAFSGQILSLAPHTHLEVVSHQQDRYLLRLVQGQVRIQEHGQVIAVETEHLRVDPLGTDYQVTRGARSSQVYLYSGAVRVTAHNGQTSLLNPGQSIQFPSGPRTLGKAPALPAPAVATLPGPAYPQRHPLPHPRPHEMEKPSPAWNEPGRPQFRTQPQSQSWPPMPELEQRRPGGPRRRPWEHSSEGRARPQQIPRRSDNADSGPFSTPWRRWPPTGGTPPR